MLIGTQYYRPPNPEPDVWAKDLQQIATLGMSIVRCWIYWRQVEPMENQWRWDDYDCFFDLAHTNGLKVVVQLLPECQPNWFLQQHRELWPRDEDGRELGQEGYGMVVLGGYPGITYDQPSAANGIARFYQQTVNRYHTHPALYVWDVWNEIQPHRGLLSYDPLTTTHWRKYLNDRFGSIDLLNRHMLSQYACFDEIPMVRYQVQFTGTQQWRVLFEEFRHWRQEQEMIRRVRLVKDIDTNHLVVAHSDNTPLIRAHQNDWLLARHLDGYGTSQYLSEYNLKKSADYCYAAMYYVVARSMAHGKPMWLSEHAGGPTFYQYGHTNKTAAEIRSNLLLAMGQGAEAAIFWQYRNERLGEEAPSWGLVDFDGSCNKRTQAVNQIATAIYRERASLAQAIVTPSAVGVVTDHRSLLYESASQSWVKQGLSSGWEAEELTVGLMEAGIPVDIHHAVHLENEAVPEHCRLLFLPMRTALNDRTIANLLAWAHNGGCLIATAYLGMYDEDGFVSRILPRQPWADAFGIQVLTRHYPTAPMLKPVSGSLPTLPGHWTVEELRVNDAEIVATWQDMPAITRRTYGKGELWYIASCPGLHKDRTALHDWLWHWARKIGITPWYEPSEHIIASKLTGPNACHVVLTNCAHDSKTVILYGTDELHGNVHSILDQTDLGRLAVADSLKLNILPRESVWLKVTTDDKANRSILKS